MIPIQHLKLDFFVKRTRIVHCLAAAISLLLLALITVHEWMLDDYWSIIPTFFLVLFAFREALIRTIYIALGLATFKGVSKDAVGTKPVKWPAGTRLPPTAIIMPIRNENIDLVAIRLRAILHSLDKIDALSFFDVFLLSDSDEPEIWIKEELVWSELSNENNCRGKIFYRHRKNPLGGKQANLADFVRRWGAQYAYIVLLDADSFVTGAAIVTMAALMDRNPPVALIQLKSEIFNVENLCGIYFQWQKNVFNDAFHIGLRWAFPYRSAFYGHNAIIRVQAFVACCGLPTFPNRVPFGGRILSHDYVEAAFLRRGGWGVWLRSDIPGAYEEAPPSLPSYSNRAARWAFGDLQHLWLFAANNFHGAVRRCSGERSIRVLLSPVFLWLSLCSLLCYSKSISPSSTGNALGILNKASSFCAAFPPSTSLIYSFLGLWIVSSAMASSVAIRKSGCLPAKPGLIRVLIKECLAWLLSGLMEPIMLISQSIVVINLLCGKRMLWTAQPRSSSEGSVTWINAASWYALHTVLAVAVATTLLTRHNPMAYWITPFLLGPLLSIPLAVYSSRSHSQRWDKVRSNLIVDENDSNSEVRELERNLSNASRNGVSKSVAHGKYGWLGMFADPKVFQNHLTLLRCRNRNGFQQEYLDGLCRALAAGGLNCLTKRQSMALLNDRGSMLWLQRQLLVSHAHGV